MLRFRHAGVRFLTAALLVAGCATAGGSVPPSAVPATTSGELRAKMRMGSAVGGVVPVAIGVSNGTQEQFAVSAERVVAVDAAGNRVAALSLAEATGLAGGGNALGAAEARYLGDAVSMPGQPLTGVVFFPDGNYYSVRIVAVAETGGVEREVLGFKAM